MIKPALFFSLCLAIGSFSPLAAHAAPSAGKTCHLPGHDRPLRCLQVTVPQDYAQKDGAQMNIHVTIAPAFREKAVDDPLFVLAGGPGQSGSSVVVLADAAFARVRATRDIIFIDQRGTGKSGKMYCPELAQSETLEPDKAEQELQTCLKKLKPQLRWYGTRAAAEDIEQVRKKLGFQRINLWGGSYGTRLAQAYARQYPQNVRSMILDGVVPPQQNLGLLSQETGLSFRILSERCAQDAVCKAKFPHFKQEVEDLITRAKSGTEVLQVQHPVTGKAIKLPLNYEGLAEVLRNQLYLAQDHALLPWLVHSAHQGNWQPLLAKAALNPSSEADGMAMGMTLGVICGEDIAHIPPAQLQRETSLSFLGDTWAKKMQRWCNVLDLPRQPRPDTTPIKAPTLLLSGAWDPVTPPSNAETAMQLISPAQHLVAPKAGHIISHLGCTSRLLRRFLDEPLKKVDGQCLQELGANQFVVSNAGAQP